VYTTLLQLWHFAGDQTSRKTRRCTVRKTISGVGLWPIVIDFRAVLNARRTKQAAVVDLICS